MAFIPTYFASSEFFKRKNIIYGITEDSKDIIMVFEEEKECSSIFDRQNKENGNSGMFAEYPDIIEIRIFLIIIQKIKDYGSRQNFEPILKAVFDAAYSNERKKYLAILKKKKLSKLYLTDQLNNERERSSSNNNNQQDTTMNNIYDDEDDVIIVVKPEIDVDQENVPSRFSANTNDVIVLGSDTEEEENNETTSKYGGSFSDEDFEKDDEGTSYGNNEDDEMSDDDDVAINIKPEIEDVKTAAANNNFRLAKDADEIIVLESDSEESND
uniref:Uncharacterized protein n=1 Tax=Panagrolaimus sp. ES5 TaxID=591445 RepID=A0AC34G9F2_9BILA